VVEWKSINVSVVATPTLLLIDKNGTIEKIWVGQLNPSTESAIVNLVSPPSAPRYMKPKTALEVSIQNFSLSDFKRQQSIQHLQLINVAERGVGESSDATVHIPLAELALRAPYELDASNRQVVDCSNISAGECEVAAMRLKEQGFSVATLNAGTYCKTCRPIRQSESQ
jgi:hypothetical protein